MNNQSLPRCDRSDEASDRSLGALLFDSEMIGMSFEEVAERWGSRPTNDFGVTRPNGVYWMEPLFFANDETSIPKNAKLLPEHLYTRPKKRDCVIMGRLDWLKRLGLLTTPDIVEVGERSAIRNMNIGPDFMTSAELFYRGFGCGASHIPRSPRNPECKIIAKRKEQPVPEDPANAESCKTRTRARSVSVPADPTRFIPAFGGVMTFDSLRLHIQTSLILHRRSITVAGAKRAREVWEDFVEVCEDNEEVIRQQVAQPTNITSRADRLQDLLSISVDRRHLDGVHFDEYYQGSPAELATASDIVQGAPLISPGNYDVAVVDSAAASPAAVPFGPPTEVAAGRVLSLTSQGLPKLVMNDESKFPRNVRPRTVGIDSLAKVSEVEASSSIVPSGPCEIVAKVKVPGASPPVSSESAPLVIIVSIAGCEANPFNADEFFVHCGTYKFIFEVKPLTLLHEKEPRFFPSMFSYCETAKSGNIIQHHPAFIRAKDDDNQEAIIKEFQAMSYDPFACQGDHFRNHLHYC